MNESLEELTDRLTRENRRELERRATHPFEVQETAGRFSVIGFGARAVKLTGRTEDGFTTEHRSLAELNADSWNQAYNDWVRRIQSMRDLLSDADTVDDACCDESYTTVHGETGQHQPWCVNK